MDFFLWGLKTNSLFDFWVIPHILSGVIIGYLIPRLNNNLKGRHIITSVLIIAYLWEIIEYFSEVGLFSTRLMNWFYGVELLPNRLLVDPSADIIGLFYS